MLAAVLSAPGRLDLVEHPEAPEPGPGQALVAVRRVGICGTDYHAFGGTQNFISYPCLLGHELAVEVLEVGPEVTDVAPGALCAVLPYLSCGTCPPCARGRTNCCERIEVLGVTRPGGLRERMVVPARLLFGAAGLTLDQLVLVETLGIGWHAVARGQPNPADTALVLGAGPIGLAVAQSLRSRVKRVLVADVSPHRADFAAAAGLESLVVGENFDARLAEHTEGVLPSLVFDASGSSASMEAAFALVGTGGTLVFVGHTPGPLTFRNPIFHALELDLRASRKEGFLDAEGWINHRTTLQGVVDSLPLLAASPGGVVKAVVEIGSSS